MAHRHAIDVDDVMLMLPYLDSGQLMALAGVQRTDADLRRAAWRSIELASGLRDGGRSLDRLRGEVAAWATRLGSIVGDEAGTGLVELELAQLRRAAAPTVLDAAAAVVFEKNLSESEHEVLVGPWDSIVSRQARTAG